MSQHNRYRASMGDGRPMVREGVRVELEAGVKHAKYTEGKSKRMWATVA